MRKHFLKYNSGTLDLGYTTQKGVIVYATRDIECSTNTSEQPYTHSFSSFENFPFKRILLHAMTKDEFKNDGSHYNQVHDHLVIFRLVLEANISPSELDILGVRSRPKMYKEISDLTLDYL